MLHSTYFYLLYTEIIWLLTFVINKPLVTVLKIHKIFVDSHKFTEPVSDQLWLVLMKLKLNLLFENNVNNFGFSECVSGVHFFKSKTLFYDVIQRGRKKRTVITSSTTQESILLLSHHNDILCLYLRVLEDSLRGVCNDHERAELKLDVYGGDRWLKMAVTTGATVLLTSCVLSIF